MTEALAVAQPTDLAPAVEAALVHGDVSSLDAAGRVSLYKHMCESQGLNPYTRPFQLMKGQDGKLFYYAGKNCADQLRKIHEVDLQIVDRQKIDDVYVVTVRARLPNGRGDEEIGAVNIGNLRGEALSNAMMKATTKAKRRVTLSIVGLSLLDESEVESVPGAVVYEESSGVAPLALQDRTVDEKGMPLREASYGKAPLQEDIATEEQTSGHPPAAAVGTKAAESPASPAASSATGPTPAPEGRKRDRRATTSTPAREALYTQLKDEFIRLCGKDRQLQSDMARHAFGSAIGTWELITGLPDGSLRRGLEKLRAMKKEHPPVDPHQQPGNASQAPKSTATSAAPGAAADSEEDVPHFPPPETNGNPQEGTQEPPGETIRGGSIQKVDSRHQSGGNGDGEQCTAVQEATGTRCLRLRHDDTAHYFAPPRPEDKVKLPAEPLVADGYISISDMRIQQLWAQQHGCAEDFALLTRKCPRNLHGNLLITLDLWKMIKAMVEAKSDRIAAF